MGTIKAIETVYNGIKYRSRLEALWAAKMDELGIEHVYEPQGYEMGRIKYLPDFYLPDLDMFAEVKGVPDEAAANKILALMQETGKDVVLLLGNGRLQFFSAKFKGYRLNDNFGKAPCAYDSYWFNELIDQDEGRYIPKRKKPKTELYASVPYEPEPEPEHTKVDEPKKAPLVSELTMLENPATLDRVWKAIMADMKRKKQAYVVVFMGTTVKYEPEMQRIKIIFKKEATFALKAAQKGEVVNALTDSACKAIGANGVQFSFEKEGD